MGIFVGTAGVNARLRRACPFDFNSPYTVTFSFYVATFASWANDFMWGASGASNANSTQLGNRVDWFGSASSVLWRLKVGDSAGTQLTYDSTQGPGTDGNWRRIALRRTASNAFNFRVNTGSVSPNANNSTTGREAVLQEMFFWDGASALTAGNGICNYKAFSRALSDAEVDAEFVTSGITILDIGDCVAACPMNDTVTLANNLTGAGLMAPFGDDWITAGAGTHTLVVGANDPAVNFIADSGFVPRRTLLGVG